MSNPAFGADGSITIFAADGTTVLLDITPSNGIRIFDPTGLKLMLQLVQDTVNFDGGSQLAPITADHGTPHGVEHGFVVQGPFNDAGPSAAITIYSGTDDGFYHPRIEVTSPGGTSAKAVYDATTGELTTANLPLVSDGMVVQVAVATGQSSGVSAATSWPKQLFTAAPIVSTQVVSTLGSAIKSHSMPTAVAKDKVTVRLDLNGPVVSATTFDVHVKGEQYTA